MFYKYKTCKKKVGFLLLCVTYSFMKKEQKKYTFTQHAIQLRLLFKESKWRCLCSETDVNIDFFFFTVCCYNVYHKKKCLSIATAPRIQVDVVQKSIRSRQVYVIYIRKKNLFGRSKSSISKHNMKTALQYICIIKPQIHRISSVSFSYFFIFSFF